MNSNTKSLLEKLVAKEIQEAISILKRKNIILNEDSKNNVNPAATDEPAPQDDGESNQNSPSPTAAPNDPSMFDGSGSAGGLEDILGGSGGDISSSPIPGDAGSLGDDGSGAARAASGDADDGSETSAEKAEEDKDPVTSAFDNIKDLSDKTEDVTKIIKSIKAKIQDSFSTPDELKNFIQKIYNDGTPIMKKALSRPELRFATVIYQSENKMKIKESELKKLAEKVVDQRVKVLKENQDFTAMRRLSHAACESVMDFEDNIIKLLNLVSPDHMSPELQDAYKNIMGEMQRKVVSDVMEALNHLSKFPRNQPEEKQSA